MCLFLSGLKAFLLYSLLAQKGTVLLRKRKEKNIAHTSSIFILVIKEHEKANFIENIKNAPQFILNNNRNAFLPSVH